VNRKQESPFHYSAVAPGRFQLSGFNGLFTVFGRLDHFARLDIQTHFGFLVRMETSPGWNEVTQDNVFLESDQVINLGLPGLLRSTLWWFPGNWRPR